MNPKIASILTQVDGNSELMQELLVSYRKKRLTASKDIEQYERGIEQAKQNIAYNEQRIHEYDVLIQLFETLTEVPK